MNGFLGDLVSNWGIAYAALLGTYLVSSLVVTHLNQTRLKHLRIQARRCPPEIVRRDIVRSVWSLVAISGFFALGHTGYQYGYGWRAEGQGLGVQALTFLASMLLFDTQFYWGHRLAHVPGIYEKVHAWHHGARTPTAWSNNSETFWDNLILQSYWSLAHLVLPIHPGVLALHKLYDQVTGALGHAGFEYAPGEPSRAPSPFVGTTFHDDHHRLFKYNFATHFSLWDRLCGTIDPGYDAHMDQMIRRARGLEPPVEA